MTTAHTAPLDLTALDDDALAALLVEVADDEDALARVLSELDARDGDDGDDAPPVEEEVISEEERRRDRLNAYREPGESLVDAASRMYGDITWERYEAASKACREILLNPAARADMRNPIDPYTLFHGNAARAMKWASDELLAWWAEHGRVSWSEHMLEWTGRARYVEDARKARATWSEVVARGRDREDTLSPNAARSYRAPRQKVEKFGAR